LRANTTTRRAPSAVDAIVVATADEEGGATVLTSDPGDLRPLARSTFHDVRIATV
jgi:predicted nucleic acid-binding protein